MFYQNLKLGILGGGQLGRMFIQACTNFNVDTHVLDPDPEAPCSKLCASFTVGSFKDYDTVINFGKSMDIITIEIEHVNVEALEYLEKSGVKVYPQPNVIRTIQDKRIQKQFYADQQIPSADFVLINDKKSLATHKDFYPAFQKLGKGGYDGGGVQYIESIEDIKKGFEGLSLLEKAVDFEKEISVITARNIAGEIAIFPVVELVFNPVYNLVDYLISPALISPEIEAKAKSIAYNVTEKLGIVGILAVEMFLTKDGDILVNESAPRPHNSGHQTINANYTSQYEQHLRAILGLPLGSTAIKTPSAMINLIGEEGYEGLAKYEGIETILGIPGAQVFLYGKKLTKPSRKMGHVTILDQNIDNLLEKVNAIKNNIKVIV